VPGAIVVTKKKSVKRLTVAQTAELNPELDAEPDVRDSSWILSVDTEHQNRQRRVFGPHAPDRVNAIDARHCHVQEPEVDTADRGFSITSAPCAASSANAMSTVVAMICSNPPRTKA